MLLPLLLLYYCCCCHCHIIATAIAAVIAASLAAMLLHSYISKIERCIRTCAAIIIFRIFVASKIYHIAYEFEFEIWADEVGEGFQIESSYGKSTTKHAACCPREAISSDWDSARCCGVPGRDQKSRRFLFAPSRPKISRILGSLVFARILKIPEI